ncbi:MAG: thiamine pyrophosphate-binding protein [Byssovorax sp.]
MSFLVAKTDHLHAASDGTLHAAIRPRVAAALVEVLANLGVESAFGVVGGAISGFCQALSESAIAYRHVRHEAGAAFAALEASLCTDRPAVVFTTTGPGLTNALTGLMSARWDGGHVIVVSAATSAAHRGRLATQETGPGSAPASLFMAGTPFDYATIVEDAAQLPGIAMELAKGLRRRQGFVAHVSLPIAVQWQPAPALPQALLSIPGVMPPAPGVAAAVAGLLAGTRFVIWAGFGARHAAPDVLALAERTGAPVMCTPRAKGVFPEDHPLYLGVTGAGGHAEIDDLLAERPADHVLVLGTRLGESSSFWSPALAPRRAFVHVDVDPEAFGRAYPSIPCHVVQSDVGAFARALAAEWPDRSPRAAEYRALPPPAPPPPRALGPVRPEVLFAAIQRRIVEGSRALVMAESGNSLCFAAHHLRFREPRRYRGSTGFAAMGHATCGVLGAALGRPGKAVAVVGDGAMLMTHEVSSAVQHRAPAVWIVLNDGGYLMCEQGMRTLGWTPFCTRIPSTDFAALARALGAEGVNVRSELDLDAALEQAMSASGPFVVDVDIDRTEPAPSGRRTRSIMQQGFDTERSDT